MNECAWCDAASTLEVEWTEMGVQYAVCSCCGKRSRIDPGQVPVRVEAPDPLLTSTE